MSVGNINSEGNKKNNFPWQLKMLQGLQAMFDLNTSLFASQIRTVNVQNVTSTGSISNAYSISIANVGNAAGLVQGASIPAGATLKFDGGVLNHVLNTVSYDATGTAFLITYITQ